MKAHQVHAADGKLADTTHATNGKISDTVGDKAAGKRLIRASVADVLKILSFYHIKCLLYYFTTLFYNIPFIRCFIIQSYTLK